MYTNAPCSLVTLSNCAITGGTASDGSGLYTAFGGLAGTTSPVSGSFHTNILVAAQCHRRAAVPTRVYPANWQTATVTSNQFNITNGATSTASWIPSAPGGVNQVMANNGTGDRPAPGTCPPISPANTSRSSTTSLTLDPDLQVTVAANAVYEVRASIGYACNSTSAGIDFDFQVPSGSFSYTETEPVSRPAAATGTYFNTAGTPDNADTGGSGNTLGFSSWAC